MINILTLFQKEGIRIVQETSVNNRGKEYKGNCPRCGGTDRLRIQPDMGKFGFFECRQCPDSFRGNSFDFCSMYLGMRTKSEIMNYLSEGKDAPIKIEKPLDVQFKFKPTTIKRPTQEWISEISKVVINSNKALHEFQPLIEYLNNRGITTDTIDEFKLGYNQEFIKYPDNTISSKVVYVPPGITIPFISHENFNEVLKLKVKSHIQGIKENPDHRFSITTGGQNGLSYILRNTDNFIVTEAELDMYTLYSQLGAAFSYIATGNNLSLPDENTYKLALECKNLFICHDNDPAGINMLAKWRKEFPHSKATPVPKGKDPAEAINESVNLKQFFMEKIC